MPLYLRHGSEKHVHRFPGCLIVSLTIRPFNQSLPRKTTESYTLGPVSCQRQSTIVNPTNPVESRTGAVALVSRWLFSSASAVPPQSGVLRLVT